MKRLLPYFFSLGLIACLSMPLMAQTDSTSAVTTTEKLDNAQVQEEDVSDSLKLTVKSGLQIYIDYGKILTLFTDFESKFEVGAAYQLKNKFSPNIQIGFSTLEPGPAFENGEYTSEGTYARVGLDYTIPFDASSLFYVGVKFGLSSYSESGSYTITTDIWPDFTRTFENDDLSANWYELIIGSEKKFKKGNWKVGGYFALRVLGNRDEFFPIDTFSIPGYGRTLDDTVPVLNLYLKYAF